MLFYKLFRSKSLFAFCALVLFASLGYCQQPGGVRLAFKTLFLNNPATEYTYLSEGEIKPFPVGLDLLSSEAVYVGSGPILVFAGKPNLEESLPEQAVATIPVDSISTKVTFICMSNASSLNCVKIETNLNAFPVGAFCFINATTDRVVGLLGEEKITIKPGATFMVEADDFEARRVPIKMAYLNESTDWRVFYSSKWSVLGDKRSFIIIYRDERSGKLRARGVNFST